MNIVEQIDARAQRIRLFQGAEWPVLIRRLKGHARRKVGRDASENDAEDLVHEAIAHGLDHLDGWQHTTTSLVDYLGSIMNGIAINRRRKRKRQQEDVMHEDDIAADSSRAPADPRAGEALHLAADLTRATVTRLEARLAGDGLALAVLALFLQDITMPKDQQAATKREMKEILAARLKIARHAAKVADELEGEVA
jgi:DNA-directed RNA polymerase specialized sigma24 family protein